MPVCRVKKFHPDSLIAVMHISGASLTVSDIVQMCCHSGKSLALGFCTIDQKSVYLGDVEMSARRILYARAYSRELASIRPEWTGNDAVIHLLQIVGQVDVSIFSSYDQSVSNVSQEVDELLLAGASHYDKEFATRLLPKAL